MRISDEEFDTNKSISVPPKPIPFFDNEDILFVQLWYRLSIALFIMAGIFGNILKSIGIFENIPTTFFNGLILRGERMLTSFFPDTEICALVLHSVVNFWGYSISKNNEKIRVRAGSAESGTFIEHGDVIEEEKALFAKSEITNGKRLFHFDDMPDEYFTDDQVGENFVFDISKRYLGEQLDADEELFETELKGFQFADTAFNKINKDHKKEKKWLKYAVIIAFIILWQIIKRVFLKD